MTNDKEKIRLALYQPDIPQNVGAAIRLAACLDVGLEIILPCGFAWDERKISRAAMDYRETANLETHESWEDFYTLSQKYSRRIILMTTKSAIPYTDFAFRPDDILLAGRESAGVPDFVHETADARLLVPMKPGLRSLNIVTASAIILGEALRQTRPFPAL